MTTLNKIIYNVTQDVNCYAGYAGYKFRLEVIENSYDLETNTSNVTINEYATPYSSGGYEDYRSLYLNINTYDSKTKTTTNRISENVTSIWPRGTEVLIGSWTGNLEHNEDGTLSLQVTSAFTHNYSSGWLPPRNVSFDTGSKTLTTIPRKTICPSVSGNVEESTTIKINPASNKFTHSMKLTLGNSVKYLNTSGGLSDNEVKLTGSSFTFNIPKEYYSEFSTPSLVGSVLLKTYNGTTSIGNSTGTLIINASSSKCTPVLTSSSLIDNNKTTANLTAGTDTSNDIVKGYSTGKLDFNIRISSSNDNNSNITSLIIDNKVYSVNTRSVTINKIENKSVNIYIKNSRGIEKTFSVSASGNLIEYIPLTFKGIAKRTTQTGGNIKIDYSGNYFNSTFGNIANSLSMNWKYKEKGATSWTDGGSVSPTLNKNTYSGTLNCGDIFDYRKQYEFIVYFNDKLVSNDSGSLPVTKGISNFEILQDGIKLNDIFLGVEMIDSENKTIKLKNDTYIDSSSVKVNESVLCDEINSINSVINNLVKIEVGSNYIKYSDGTMIEFGTYTRNACVNTPWGNWYEATVESYTFPVTFKTLQALSIMPIGRAFWVEYGNALNTGTGTVYIARPVADSTTYAYTFSYVAIGTWK